MDVMYCMEPSVVLIKSEHEESSLKNTGFLDRRFVLLMDVYTAIVKMDSNFLDY